MLFSETPNLINIGLSTGSCHQFLSGTTPFRNVLRHILIITFKMDTIRLNFFFNLSYTTKNMYKFRISVMCATCATCATCFPNFIPLAMVSLLTLDEECKLWIPYWAFFYSNLLKTNQNDTFCVEDNSQNALDRYCTFFVMQDLRQRNAASYKITCHIKRAFRWPR